MIRIASSARTYAEDVIIGSMKADELKELFDRVRDWPEDQQERAIEILVALENSEADTDWLLGNDAVRTMGK
jgi:hypothetical protein